LERMTGLGEVGVFSIGIQITETIWIFSRSISLVQYSNVLNLGDTIKSRKETEKMSLLSFYISFACILIIILLPANFFTFIFGDEFADVKRVILLLSPGTLAIAASNVFGNYFSAIGKLKILIIKSLVGLIFTIILSYILIPKMQIQGASIVNSISYIVSSVILFGYYYFVHKKNAIVKK
jgi:O-antigen/teichoic acid export membrane protein